MRNYRNYTNDEIITFVSQVKSLAGLLKALNLKPAGGNYAHMKRILQNLNADCRHWTGQAWNRNQRLKDWSSYNKAHSVKKHLIKLRGNYCEECKITHWRENIIRLEVHHKDGERTNNDINNLILLCPNCHSYTGNFRKSNGFENTVKKDYSKDLCSCGKTKCKTSNLCRECADKQRKKIIPDKPIYIRPTKIQWPMKEELHRMVWNYPLIKLSEILGVSDNAIKKHCKKYQIECPKLGYWLKKSN